MVKKYSTETQEHALNVGIDFKNQVFENLSTIPEEELLTNYKSIGDYVNESFKLQINSIDTDGNLQDAVKSVLISTINDENNISGCKTLYDLNVKGFLEYIDLDGDLQWIFRNKGYCEIVKAIDNDILTDCIKFNEEVDKIEHVDINGKSKMRVACTNRNVYVADSVILTMSVEVLKMFELSNKFDSMLTVHKIKSLNKLCLGQVVKVYFKFKEPLDGEYKFIRFYPSADNFGMEVFEKYSQLISFDRIKNSDWWLIWLLGDLVDEFENNKPIDFMNGLFRIYKENYPEFPNLGLDTESITFSDWTVNPLFGGSYSYLKIGASSKDILNLAEPVFFNEASLLFAGGMTDTEFYSTTHGAYVSGIREAERMNSIFKINSEEECSK